MSVFTALAKKKLKAAIKKRAAKAAAALKKSSTKVVKETKKHAKDMVTKKTPGQAKVVTPVKAQRQYRKGTRVAAGVGFVAGLATSAGDDKKIKALNKELESLRAQLKKSKTETARAQTQIKIEKTLAKLELAKEKAKNNSSVIKKSLRPQTRKTLAPSKSQRPKIRSDK